MNLLRDYRADLLEALKDPREAAEYINAAMEENDPKTLAIALQDVAEAQTLAMSEADSEAFSHIRASLAKAGLKLTVEAR